MPSKQKSGLYRSKDKIGVDAQAKDVFKWISVKTKRELEDTRREVEARYIGGTGLLEDHLLGEYAAQWYRVRKEPFVAPSTRAGYRTMLNKHILPAFSGRNLRAIGSIDLQTFINQFSGKSKSQITCAMTTLKGIFSAALADRIIAINPALNLRRPEATQPEEKRALTDDERKRLKSVFVTHTHGSYLAVMYYTGMRPGEARGLKWGDFDWADDLIHVQRDIDYAAVSDMVGTLKSKA
ncbi:MAG: site-specific integrase, partial [Clostridia bacterium]